MKKKILFSLIVVALFIMTGCGKSSIIEANDKQNRSNSKNVVTIQGEEFNLKSERVLGDLHYKENYVDFHTDQIGNMRIMSYIKQGNTIFEVRVRYDENRPVSELKAILEMQTSAKEQSKEVNGIKYIYYDYKSDDGLTVHHYMYVHKEKVYSIGFFLGENSGNIEEVFMNNVLFE